MSKFRINDIEVNFPYEPYEAQKKYIEQLLKALTSGEHALLESPTGTGKTLCLLCGALAWQRAIMDGEIEDPDSDWGRSDSSEDQLDRDPTIPTIFFASRTHGQLAQVISELKKTAYVSDVESMLSTPQSQLSPTNYSDLFEQPGQTSAEQQQSQGGSGLSSSRLKVTVLGSRDRMCVNPDLGDLSGPVLTAACRQKVKAKRCKYEQGLSQFSPDCFSTPRDIEDLRNYGRKAGFCPYYAAKNNHTKCDLVLLPYEYLLSLTIRPQFEFNLRNSVIIFDEGHNIERAAESFGSFELSCSTLKTTVAVLKRYRKSIVGGKTESDQNLDFRPRQLKDQLEIPLKRLIKYLDAIKLNPPDKNHSTHYLTSPSGSFLSLLTVCGLMSNHMALYNSMLSKCSNWVGGLAILPSKSDDDDDDDDDDDNDENDDAMELKKAKAVSDTLEALTVALSDFARDEFRWFRVYISEGEKMGRVLGFWCFSAGVVLSRLVRNEHVHSLIITSGTLSPTNSYAQALGEYGLLEYQVQFTNNHVIRKEQISLQVISNYDNQSIHLIYKNRADIRMTQATGKAACKIVRNVPGGVLVFFSSYTQMDSMLSTWEKMGEWEMLCQTKQVFEEPNSPTPEDFEAFIADFKTAASKENIRRIETGYSGAVMFAVARGRISEGMNLADDLCRCVIVIGIPHPPMKDPKIQLKQLVFNEVFPNEKRGNQWYQQQAGFSINQSIGRVIRHIDDYGLVVLIDKRFEWQQQINQLSGWIRPLANRQTQRSDQDIINNINAFFTKHYKPAAPEMTQPKNSKEILGLQDSVDSSTQKELDQSRKRMKLNHP